MSGRLQGKIAVVTGGASGIGEACVRLFVAEGAEVVLTDLNVEQGQALASSLGGKASFLRQDVSDPQSWDALAAHLAERGAGLDVLVNNAAVLLKANIEQESLEQWHRLLRINADSVFLGTQMAVRLMKDSGGGSIVNISSLAALLGLEDYVAYSASKGAVAALSRAVAVHCRKHKYRIRCNSVHPDGVMTPMTLGGYPKGMDPSAFTIDADPMNRMCLPSDVANAVLYLASDESRAINGIEMRVDSGQAVMGI